MEVRKVITLTASPRDIPTITFRDGNDHKGAPVAALQVSKFVTSVDLPREFHATTLDPDNFQIEVWDSSVPGNRIRANTVELEALRPDGTAFSPPRKILVELERLPHSSAFTSKFLRLVVDEEDQKSNPTQTLLTDWDQEHPDVEILGQIIEARYRGPSGTVSARATVGVNPMFFPCAIHVLRDGVGARSKPLVEFEHVLTRLRKWLRRSFAQINLSPKLVHCVAVNPVANVLTVFDVDPNDAARGARAGSEFTLGVKVQGPGIRERIHSIGPYIVPRNRQSPRRTAADLAALIRQKVPSLETSLRENPVPLGIGMTSVSSRSVDLIIRDNAGGLVSIVEATSSDDGQKVFFLPRASPDVESVSRLWSLVGSLGERALIHNYESGADHLDIFIVRSFSNTPERYGQAITTGTMVNNFQRSTMYARGTVFIRARAMDKGDDFPFVFAHECGHALLDAGHVVGDATQLMAEGLQVTNHIGAPKRISALPTLFNAPPEQILQGQRVRSFVPSLLTPM